jgi:F-type H+-transporting ATPase subunit gamma
MRDIRTRIKSVKDTMSITKAMKLISASKLKKAREQFESTIPFFDKIQSTLKFILSHTSGEEALHYFDNRDDVKDKKVGFVVITGDKGLCGGYNSNVIKLAEQEFKSHSLDNAKIIVVGNVGKIDFIKKGYRVDLGHSFVVQNPTLSRAREIANEMISLFDSREIDEIYLIFTEMENSLNLKPKVMKLLPLEPITFKQTEEEYEEMKYLLEFEFNPSMEVTFNRLVPQYLRGITYGALVESFTSEQSARMTAMDGATKNANDLLSDLNLRYNRIRQGIITQEISEIVGGAEAQK